MGVDDSGRQLLGKLEHIECAVDVALVDAQCRGEVRLGGECAAVEHVAIGARPLRRGGSLPAFIGAGADQEGLLVVEVAQLDMEGDLEPAGEWNAR